MAVNITAHRSAKLSDPQVETSENILITAEDAEVLSGFAPDTYYDTDEFPDFVSFTYSRYAQLNRMFSLIDTLLEIDWFYRLFTSLEGALDSETCAKYAEVFELHSASVSALTAKDLAMCVYEDVEISEAEASDCEEELGEIKAIYGKINELLKYAAHPDGFLIWG